MANEGTKKEIKVFPQVEVVEGDNDTSRIIKELPLKIWEGSDGIRVMNTDSGIYANVARGSKLYEQIERLLDESPNKIHRKSARATGVKNPKPQPKWKSQIPHEVELRLEEHVEHSLEVLIAESKELLSVIEAGSSWYNDDPEEEYALVAELKTFIRKYNRYVGKGNK